MVPILFRVGPFAVPTHGFFTALGFLVAGAVFTVDVRRRGTFDMRLAWIVAGILLGGAIGAKLGESWRYVVDAAEPTVGGVFLYGGKSLVGGLAGAYVGAIVAKRIVGYRGHTGDLFAPAVAIGLAVGRVGCFLTEQIGTPTSMPWGIRLSAETAASIPNCPWCRAGVPLHPSFLYEIAFHLAAFVLLLWLVPRVRTAGAAFKGYLLAYAVFRFAVEFVRGNPVMWAGLSGTQLFLIPSIALLCMAIWRMGRLPSPAPSLVHATGGA